MSETYVQLPPDGSGKQLRAIKRLDNRHEEVTVPVSKDDSTDLKALWDKLSALTQALESISLDTLRVKAGGETKTLKTAKIDHGGAGNNEIVPAVSGKKIKVYAVLLVVTGAVNCQWRSASTGLTGDMNFGSKGEGYAMAINPTTYLFATVASEALNLWLSAAVAVDGFVAYWDDDAT